MYYIFFLSISYLDSFFFFFFCHFLIKFISVGETLAGNVYIVISGATDGSIAFWDLTGTIEVFMKRLSTLHQETFIDFQKRPRTGRGSQGGRRRRSLSTVTKGRPIKDLVTKKGADNANLSIKNQDPYESSSKVDISIADTACSQPVCSTSSELILSTSNSSSETSEIQPIHVLTNVHQSGVNCLHVAAVNGSECVNNCFLYHVISGGDDQALHCLTFDLSLLSESPSSEIMESESECIKRFILQSEDCNHKYMVRFLRSHKIASAHSSAIKGKRSLYDFTILDSVLNVDPEFHTSWFQLKMREAKCLTCLNPIQCGYSYSVSSSYAHIYYKFYPAVHVTGASN